MASQSHSLRLIGVKERCFRLLVGSMLVFAGVILLAFVYLGILLIGPRTAPFTSIGKPLTVSENTMPSGSTLPTQVRNW